MPSAFSEPWLRAETQDICRKEGRIATLPRRGEWLRIRLALEAGCHHAWVDTFSFQARHLYEKLGYRLFGALPDYPRGQTRYFLAKDLKEQA
jgi:hypothetical protein